MRDDDLQCLRFPWVLTEKSLHIRPAVTWLRAWSVSVDRRTAKTGWLVPVRWAEPRARGRGQGLSRWLLQSAYPVCEPWSSVAHW